MSVTFQEFTERIANEYTQLNLLEKRVNQFFNSLKINFETQPASQLLLFLKDQCGQFKLDKEKLVVKQTQLDNLQTKQVGDKPDPVARERRRELYAKLDFLDAKLARLIAIQLGGLKKELDEHFASTITFLNNWYNEALATIILWTETIDGLPVNKRYEFFEWIQFMYNQLHRTCMHYEELLDELSCEAHNTSHKRKHRTGLETLKSNLKAISTNALKSKNNSTNNHNNTQKQHLHVTENIFKHLGVSALTGEDFTLTPVSSNDSLHGHLSNLIQAFNSSNLPSFYGLFAGKPSRVVQMVQAFAVVNNKREKAFCLARDQVQAKNSLDFNINAIQQLKQHPVRAGMIDSINTWLFYGGNWANICRAMETGVPLLPTRFGSAAILLDTVEATNEYIPCMKCNSGDILTDSLCACTKQEEYIPVLLCCAMLGNMYLAKRANNDGEEFDQARNHFDSLLIEELSFGGQGRRRNFVVFNSDLVFAKYLLICKRVVA